MTDGNRLEILEGYWQSAGYGLLAHVKGNQIQISEYTAVSCLPVENLSSESFFSRYTISINRTLETFKLRHDGSVSAITFEAVDRHRIDNLCLNALTRETDDAMQNFDVLWHTFHEHYAFFGERGIDWNGVYAEHRPRLTRSTEKHNLRRSFGSILAMLKDGHVDLYIDGDTQIDVVTDLQQRLADECHRRSVDCDVHDYWRNQIDRFDQVLKTAYLNNNAKTALDDEVIWGHVAPWTGYLRIDSMSDLARTERATSIDDMQALEVALDRALADIGKLPTLIVDIRLNGGGYDNVALSIASRFTDKPFRFGTKSTIENGKQAGVQPLVVEPYEGRRYGGRVAVLTSGNTASAAEVFALAMRALPHVSIIGSRTEGIFSDKFYRTLPNGWNVSLSNQIYRDLQHTVFEGTGIPPDVATSFLSADDRRKGTDTGIETAIKVLTAAY